MEPRKHGIGRVWRGRTTPANADAYQEHLRTETLPGLLAIEGFEQGLVLRRVTEDEVEFLVLTLWESEQAIHSFAGEDPERAVIPPAAQQVLKEWDERALHFHVAMAVTTRRVAGTTDSRS